MVTMLSSHRATFTLKVRHGQSFAYSKTDIFFYLQLMLCFEEDAFANFQNTLNKSTLSPSCLNVLRTSNNVTEIDQTIANCLPMILQVKLPQNLAQNVLVSSHTTPRVGLA